MTEVKKEYINQKKEMISEDYNWYEKGPEDCHEALTATINRIDNEQSYRTNMNIKHAKLYNNLEILGLNLFTKGTAKNISNKRLDEGRVTFNLIKSCIDTVTSKIAKAKPKPQFLTSGGDYKLQERAKKLTKYVEGIFYATDYYKKTATIFKDAGVFGSGFIKFYTTDDGKIECERVIPEEIKVDDNDGIYGDPNNIYHVKLVSRQLLYKLYPQYKDKIRLANSVNPNSNNGVELIKVKEAWHKGPGGKHVICIENCTIMHEDYEDDFFPFLKFNWNDRLSGYFGQGLAEELVGTQFEINKILRNIQLAQDLIAIPRIAIESNSKVSTDSLNNKIGSIIKYQGGTKPPVFFNAQGMNAEVYNHLKWLIESGYEKTGISQLSATSKKPSGLDSAVALREYSDIETERFMLTAMNYESLALDAAEIIINLSRKLFKDNKNINVKVPGKDFIETIDWKDVDLDDDKYSMKAYPTNLLPTNPAGRLQKVQELIQIGFIDKDKALELLDFPDLEQFQDLEISNLNLVEKNISKMLESGEYIPPEPQMNLEQAALIAHKHYLKSRVNDIEEDRLELLLRFMDDADRLHKIKNPQNMITPDMVPNQEMEALAEPEQLPISDLIPQK